MKNQLCILFDSVKGRAFFLIMYLGNILDCVHLYTVLINYCFIQHCTFITHLYYFIIMLYHASVSSRVVIVKNVVISYNWFTANLIYWFWYEGKVITLPPYSMFEKKLIFYYLNIRVYCGTLLQIRLYESVHYLL